MSCATREKRGGYLSNNMENRMETLTVLYELVAAVHFLAIVHKDEHPGLALLLQLIADKAEGEIDSLI